MPLSLPPHRVPPPVANSDPAFRALRNVKLRADAVAVSSFDLERAAGTFHVRSGSPEGSAAPALINDHDDVLAAPNENEKGEHDCAPLRLLMVEFRERLLA